MKSIIAYLYYTLWNNNIEVKNSTQVHTQDLHSGLLCHVVPRNDVLQVIARDEVSKQSRNDGGLLQSFASLAMTKHYFLKADIEEISSSAGAAVDVFAGLFEGGDLT